MHTEWDVSVNVVARRIHAITRFDRADWRVLGVRIFLEKGSYD